jgi:hypothetical protein
MDWSVNLVSQSAIWVRHDYNTIIKFADDTTVVGLITDNGRVVPGHPV